MVATSNLKKYTKIPIFYQLGLFPTLSWRSGTRKVYCWRQKDHAPKMDMKHLEENFILTLEKEFLILYFEQELFLNVATVQENVGVPYLNQCTPNIATAYHCLINFVGYYIML